MRRRRRRQRRRAVAPSGRARASRRGAAPPTGGSRRRTRRCSDHAYRPRGQLQGGRAAGRTRKADVPGATLETKVRAGTTGDELGVLRVRGDGIQQRLRREHVPVISTAPGEQARHAGRGRQGSAREAREQGGTTRWMYLPHRRFASRRAGHRSAPRRRWQRSPCYGVLRSNTPHYNYYFSVLNSELFSPFEPKQPRGAAIQQECRAQLLADTHG